MEQARLAEDEIAIKLKQHANEIDNFINVYIHYQEQEDHCWSLQVNHLRWTEANSDT